MVSARVAALALVCCACGFHPNAAQTDAPPPVDVPVDNPVVQPILANCSKLHAAQPELPSGQYMIDPDGDGGFSPISVWCDMTTDGGGWSLVFLATNDNMMATPITYTSGSPGLMADSTTALLAYRDASMAPLPDDHAWVTMPADWRSNAPFNSAGTDVTVPVSINGGPPAPALLRYGNQSFTTTCWDPWISGAWGRICIRDTEAPFFNAFASTTQDGCGDSISAYSANNCAANRLFSIAVR